MATRRIQNRSGSGNIDSRPVSTTRPRQGVNKSSAVTAPGSAHHYVGSIRLKDIGLAHVVHVRRDADTRETKLSPQQELMKYIRPTITNISVLRPESIVSLLSKLQTDIIPRLKESQELKSVAETVIKDEKLRYQEYLDRFHNGLLS